MIPGSLRGHKKGIVKAIPFFLYITGNTCFYPLAFLYCVAFVPNQMPCSAVITLYTSFIYYYVVYRDIETYPGSGGVSHNRIRILVR